ncbi:tetratricopeptide repeat protein [Flavobacterium sp.]|uniref:tetratricopeptide repeat-containing sensor histidine kinase n=1 Tax=Flavobacterium sp. TaxID=239 RepID=UPI003527CF4C
MIFSLFACESNIQNNSLYLNSYNKAEELFDAAKYDAAFYYYQKTKLLCESENDFENIMYPILMMSEIQRIKNDYSGCEETVTEALKYVTKNTKKSYITFIYNNLGIALLEQANYNEAQKYYEKSLAITSDAVSKCIIQNNIAYSYIKQKKFGKAKTVLESILNNNALKANLKEYARVIDNLGYVLFQLNDKNALNYLQLSKQLREKENDVFGLTASYIHFAEFYENNNPNIAKNNALKAYEMAKITNNTDDKIEALQFITKLAADDEAKQFALQTFNLTDSIKLVRQREKNEFAKIKYDSKEALKELKKQKQLKELFVISIITVFGLALFIFYRIKKTNKQKIRETAYQTETRIAKKLHDELANDVHNAIAFAETQNLENFTNKETLLENLETIYNRARNISNENKSIDTGTNYIEKLKIMLTTYNSENRNVIINLAHFNASKTPKEIKIIIYRVLQELMVNMKKHSQCTLVSIAIIPQKKVLQINYSDNGKGTNNLKNLKNGLQNVENRIFSINGTIIFDTSPENGFKVTIEIPKQHTYV